MTTTDHTSAPTALTAAEIATEVMHSEIREIADLTPVLASAIGAVCPTVDLTDALLAEVADLIGTATVVVGWPEDEAAPEPEVSRLRSALAEQRVWMDRLIAEETRHLRERLAVADQLADAVRAWAQALEDAPNGTVLLGQPHSDLYDAYEEHRVTTLALDTAGEQVDQ